MSKSVSRNFTTNSRILNEILTKYRNTFYAFCQLIDNAIQAKSKTISITVEYTNNELSKSPIKSIGIIDDGYGVPQSEFEDKIMEIGTRSKDQGQGIGRFAALQIGGNVEIETVAWDNKTNFFTKIYLPINVDVLNKKRLNELNFPTDETILKGKRNTYYSVMINQLYHGSQEKVSKKNQISLEFLEANFRLALFEQYPYEIFNETVKFIVNETPLKRTEFIYDKPTVKKASYVDRYGTSHLVSFYFYHVKLLEKKVTVFLQVENGGIKSVAHKYSYSSNLHIEDLGCRYIYVESNYFTTDLFRNLDMAEIGDDEMSNLKNFIKEEITNYLLTISKSFQSFTEKLKEAYPSIYNHESSQSQQIVFEKIAFLVDDKFKILDKRDLKDLIFPLLERAITDGNIVEIIDHITHSDKETTAKFKDLLQISGLKDVVQFSYSVAKKEQFLDFLHQMCYGKISIHILERSQLHKIIETQLWVFGEAYSGTPILWSDKNLLNILSEIREKHIIYDPSDVDDNLVSYQDKKVNDITDLFFCNEKALDDGRREYMIVELKAPKCKISQKELNQIDRYAFDIDKHAGVPSHRVKFKLYLISSDYSEFGESKVKAAHDKTEVPFLYDTKPTKNIEVYVLTWADLINMNRQKLSYMSEQLSVKDKSVRKHFEDGYSHLISSKFKSALKTLR